MGGGMGGCMGEMAYRGYIRRRGDMHIRGLVFISFLFTYTPFNVPTFHLHYLATLLPLHLTHPLTSYPFPYPVPYIFAYTPYTPYLHNAPLSASFLF